MNNQDFTLQNLIFRRQFLLGPAQFKPTELWSSFYLPNGLILSAHPELKVVLESQKQRAIAIIGLIVDTLNPSLSMLEIARKLLDHGTEIREIINLTKSLTGRWVIIFQDKENTFVFTDPCGFRTVFYTQDKSITWCGSQPEIINAINPQLLNNQKNLIQFILSEKFNKRESAWVGKKTIYENCHHLLPNHFLDLSNCNQCRFFPSENQQKLTHTKIIESATRILKGAIEGIINQSDVIQAITAGWDSRVLLAASRDHSSKIEYYVDRMGILDQNHPDVLLPNFLAKKLKIRFNVRNSTADPPGWFISMLSKNVSGARILPKTRIYYNHFVSGENRININGNGSEICRNLYDKYLTLDVNKKPPSFFTDLLGYSGCNYVADELEEWLTDLNLPNSSNFRVLDFLYWEQRIGNWGSQFPAEQDLAIDEFSPFNCRLLIETLMMAPKEARCAPKYKLYKELINEMWPEALSIPIMSEPILSHMKKQAKKYFTMFLKVNR